MTEPMLFEKQLKPCPFCGGQSECITDYSYGKARGAHCVCTKCGVEQGKIYASRQGAINAWNRRKEK